MLIIFGTLIVCFILSFPISFSLIISSIFYMIYYGVPLMTIPQQLAVSMDNYTLIAIAGFIFAGQEMNSLGISSRIFKFANSLVGHIPGGLAQANVLASIIFAGMSGSAIADAAGIGTVEIKGMVEQGFKPSFSAAVTGASAIIGPIIPPSVVALIYAASAGVSVGKIFLAGVVPGLMMGISMMVLIYYTAKKRNYPMQKRATFKKILYATKKAFPSLMTPIIILGGITSGIFTPTEASVITAAYAIAIGVLYKTFDLKSLYEVLLSVTEEMGGVGLLIACAVTFSWVLTHASIPTKAANLLLSLSENPLVVLGIINVFLLIVGCFMDPSAAILVLVPVFLPVLDQLGISRLHFGVVMILNLMIGLFTPPVGPCLYIMSSLTNLSLERVVRATMPFIIPLIIVLLIITYFPVFSLWLPTLLMG